MRDIRQRTSSASRRAACVLVVGAALILGGQAHASAYSHASSLSLIANPFSGPGVELTGEEEAGDRFGWQVSLSADGNTALVTAPSEVQPPHDVWVLTRSGTHWTQQARLGLPFRPGSFGYSSALSADGNTALIGGAQTNGTFVFTREGSVWSYGGELPAAGLGCGFDVGLSADGDTALVGCPAEFGGDGTVLVFVRSAGEWSEQARLSDPEFEHTSEGQFGRGVALSADGNTALISAPFDFGRSGEAWVFVRSGSTWAVQGERLTGAEEAEKAVFGEHVALSADGSTALVGSETDSEDKGAAWIFARSGSQWVEQGRKLTGDDESGVSQFGFSGVLSSDGQTALIGGPSDGANTGAVWVFEHSGANWVQAGPKFVGEAGEYGQFGTSIALSGDGNTVLVGAPGANGNAGAAWAYLTASFPAPTITRIVPKKGPAVGGTNVTVTGANFVDVTGVSFGGRPAGFVVNSSTSITVTSPAGTAGVADMAVQTPWGTSASTTKGRFTYSKPTVTQVSPASGPTSGGNSVELTGSGFATGAGTSVSFGAMAATAVECVSISECVATVPPAKKHGTVSVTVSVNGHKSAKSTAANYTYE